MMSCLLAKIKRKRAEPYKKITSGQNVFEEVDLMNTNSVLYTPEYKIDDELFATYSALRYGIVQQPVMEEADKTFINSLLENFKLNVSALNNYLDCPLKFYYNTLMRVPGEYSESAQFGSSMHEALNAYYRTMMNDAERKYPEKDRKG